MTYQQMRMTGLEPYTKITADTTKEFCAKAKQNKFLPKSGPHIDQTIRRLVAIADDTSTLTPQQMSMMLDSFPNADNIIREMQLNKQAGKHMKPNYNV